MIDPFKNDHQSQQIGRLIIENQTDKVTIYGDLDIPHSASGLAQAQALKSVIDAIVKELSTTLASTSNTSNTHATEPQCLPNTPSTQEPSMGTQAEAIEQKQLRKLVDNPFS